MQKHISFWIGFFIAFIIAVPIAAGIIGAIEAEIREAAVFIFFATAGILLVLALVLFGREWILRKVLGRTESALEDVAKSLIDVADAASTGEKDRAVAAAKSFVSQGIAWYSWSTFYRWVIATAMGLLVTFGAFVGTILLFEQTRTLQQQTETLGLQTIALEEQSRTLKEQSESLKLQTERFGEQTSLMTTQTTQLTMQNEILTLSLVSELRSQILNTSQERSFNELMSEDDILSEDGILAFAENRDCALQVTDYKLVEPPGPGTINAMVAIAKDGLLADRVVEALEFLTEDHDPVVALTAVRVLDKLETANRYSIYSLNGIFVEEMELLGRHNLYFDNSVIGLVECENCNLSFETSFAQAGVQPVDGSLDFVDSILIDPAGTTSLGTARGTLIFPRIAANSPTASHHVDFMLNGFDDNRAAISRKDIDNAVERPCTALNELARRNPLVDYKLKSNILPPTPNE